MTSPFEKLEQFFHKKIDLSKKELSSLFDEAEIPDVSCWRAIYRVIFDSKIRENSSFGRHLTTPQFKPVMLKALQNARTGVFTEKSLLALIKDYNATLFSVCDNQLTDVLNELNLLTNEFISISREKQEKVESLESETVKTVRSDIPIKDKVKLIKRKFKETINFFQKDLVKLDKLNHTDYLTDLYNRRFFDEQLKIELTQALQEKTWVNLLMIDIDDFKRFNDRYGHLVGDQALKTISKHIRDSCHEKSSKAGIVFFPTRYGGEEFAIILPAVDNKEALETAELIRTKISNYNFVIRNKKGQIKYKNLNLTVSIGISVFNHSQGVNTGKKMIVQEADEAMYGAKKSGKNCVKMFSK